MVITGRDKDGRAWLTTVVDIDCVLALLDVSNNGIDHCADIVKGIELML